MSMDEATTDDVLTEIQRQQFADCGYLELGQVLGSEELAYFTGMFDADRERFPYFWHPYGHRQEANYDALVTTPDFDQLIRHPKILPTVESLMGGPVAFGEIGLRMMREYEGEEHTAWHRDRGYLMDHPLRMDYMQLLVYLTDVNESTHCFSISPESIHQEPLRNVAQQLERGGILDIYGPAGSCVLFNVALLHTATTRPTKSTRKTVQIYYGHRHRPPLANDSGIPATFWRDHEDAETRAFYGLLNERTKLFMKAFGQL